MRNLFPTSTSRPLATLALLLAAGAAPAQTPASFGAVSTYSTGAGSNPASIAVADVNGDGRPDLVTANNSSSGTAGVLLGQAGGGFAPINSYPAGGSNTYGIAVADVNGDGRLDIVTVNRQSNTAGVLLAQAGGGFAPVSSYSTGTSSSPLGIAVADVNGDGRPDLLTASIGSNAVGVLLGQAGGGFAPVSNYSTGANSNPYSIAVGDINGDGRLDLVTANSSNSTAGVLLGLAGGSFAAVSSYSTGIFSGPVSIAVADVNGDRRLDIVTANPGSATAAVLLAQAGGGFALVNSYTTGASSFPQGIAVADVNGDGRPDLLTANSSSNAVGVLLGLAGGGFAPVSNYSTGPSSLPQGIAVADVNGDGRPDLVTANDNNNTVSVLLNTGTFTPLAAAPTTPANDVVLFPNPAHGGFAVQLPAAWGASSAQAELRNALGQEMTLQVWSGRGAFIFATEGLAPGVYVLRVQAAGKTLLRRVVLN